MRIGRIFVLSLAIICGAFSFVLAGEVMPWLTPTSIGGVNTEVYYAHSTQKVKLVITGHETPFDYVSQKINMKCTFRPGLGLEVYGLAGVVGSELKDGNLSYYKGKMDDALYGGGIRYVLLGDIVILPAVSFALGLTYSSSYLTKENGNENDFKLDATELQGSVTASKKIGMVTPYAGLKFFHNWIRWKDEKGDKGKGDGGDISPFLGAKISFSPLLSIKGEISFADEVTYAGGLGLSLGL